VRRLDPQVSRKPLDAKKPVVSGREDGGETRQSILVKPGNQLSSKRRLRRGRRDFRRRGLNEWCAVMVVTGLHRAQVP